MKTETIDSGKSLWQRFKGLFDKEDFMKLSSDKDFLAFYDIDAPTFEGYLFPDTYKIPKGMDSEDAIGMMINKLREKYSGELRVRLVSDGS